MANKHSHIDDIHDQQVSDMHSALSKESPSAELDAHIINTAKQGLEGAVKAQRVPLKAYSIAASLCVSVLVVSMYLNNNLTPPQQTLSIEAPTEFDKVLQVRPAGNANDSLENASDFQENANDSQENESDLEEIIVTGSRIRTQDSQEAVRLESEYIEIQRQTARLAEAEGIAESVNAESIEPAQIDFDNASLAQENAIVVSDAQELRNSSYRNNQNLWLQEIARLQLSDLQEDALLAEQEIILFSASYPEIEVESALNDLE